MVANDAGETVKEGETAGLHLEVDLHYPWQLHDMHNDLPLAPNHKHIQESEVSERSKRTLEINGHKFNKKSMKLCSEFNDRVRYVVDVRNLQYYLSKGLVLTKVHRVLGFAQKAWMKAYVESASHMRAQKGISEFEKSFWKLSVNSVFGKQMENIRKRFQPMKFVTNGKQHAALVRKNNYAGLEVKYSDNLMSVMMRKTEVTLNKPIAIGMTVLDLSKLHMFKFHYDVMTPFYGHKKLRLNFTDTDSLFYMIETDDLYRDLQDPRLNAHWDFSNYPKAHPLYSVKNKKVPGYMKDEMGGYIIKEFAGCRSKMYAFQLATAFGDGMTVKTLIYSVKNHTLPQCCFANRICDILRSNTAFETAEKPYYSPHERAVRNDCTNDEQFEVMKTVKKMEIVWIAVSTRTTTGPRSMCRHIRSAP